ncbi:MAG TPA: hypothetical protein VFQ63_00010 [Patescibacteria group bacterium]|nr:hypothetical protein [Patescibacteria group bacterium]
MPENHYKHHSTKYTSPEMRVLTGKGIQAFMYVDLANYSYEQLVPLEEKVSTAFLNEDGRPWSYKQVAQFTATTLYDSSEYAYVPHYYYYAYCMGIWAGESVRKAKDYLAAQTPTARIVKEEQEADLLTAFETLAQAYGSVNPLHETKSDAPTFSEIMNIASPLSEEDRKRLDRVFGAPESSEDIALALFLKASTRMSGLDVKYERQMRKFPIPRDEQRKFLSLGETVKQYFSYWEGRVLSLYFNKESTEDTFPADMPLLKYIVAGAMTREFTMLPEMYNQMLDGGLFSDLEDEAKEYLKTEYARRFEANGIGEKRHGGSLETRLDDAHLNPYAVAKRTLQAGNGAKFIDALPTPETTDETDSLKSEFIAQFKPINTALGDIVYTVSNENGVVIDIGRYNADYIDILFVSEDGGEGVAFQIDKQGRIYGIPPELSEKAHGLVNRAMATALTSLREQQVLRQEKSKAAPVVLFGARREAASPASVVPVEERTFVPRIPKKRELRRLGLLPAASEESVQPIKNGGPEKKYAVIYASAVREAMGELSQAQREAVNQIVGLVEQGGRLRKVQPFEKTGLYRARVGDIRILFTQDGPNLTAVALEDRKAVYAKISKQAAALVARAR